jgi:hypothetical protein
VLKEREALVRQLSEAHSNSKYDTSFLPQYRCDFGVPLIITITITITIL